MDNHAHRQMDKMHTDRWTTCTPTDGQHAHRQMDNHAPKAGIPQEEVAERTVAHGRPSGREELDVLVRQERAVGHQALGGQGRVVSGGAVGH